MIRSILSLKVLLSPCNIVDMLCAGKMGFYLELGHTVGHRAQADSTKLTGMSLGPKHPIVMTELFIR